MEEVFLRIGHGEDQKSDKKKLKLAKECDLDPKEVELNEYSISTHHERSLLVQLKALLIMKVLVLMRDPKTAFADFILPILLITFGLYYSSIELLS